MKLSLAKKTVIWVVIAAVLVGVFAIAVYNKGSYDLLIAQYEHYSIDVAKLVAVEIDADRIANVQKAILDVYKRSDNKVLSDKWGTPEFESYVSQFEFVKEMDDYKSILSDLRRMQSQLDVDCLYITWVDVENECYVYLIDAALEEACPPGVIDPLYFVDNEKVLSSLKEKGMTPNISKTQEYGWLMATGMPIFDENGEILAMADVDILMNAAMSELMRFMNYIIYAFIAITVLICVLAIIVMRRRIIKPIGILARAASQYKNNNNVFSEVNIKRNDEIGVLADSMKKMESDINNYISDLTSAREHADKLNQVANTDVLTQVLNKRAFESKVSQLNENKTPYGIALVDINDLKKINDNYGHEKGNVSIQIVCQFICQVFDRSCVYRVGGDEFVVVIENDDYDRCDEMIKELLDLYKANESDASKQPWERVTAAVGYSLYNPDTDEGVDSVEQRADEEMYSNKKQWKHGSH